MSTQKLTLAQASGRVDAAAPTARPPAAVAAPPSLLSASLTPLHGPRGMLARGGSAESLMRRASKSTSFTQHLMRMPASNVACAGAPRFRYGT